MTFSDFMSKTKTEVKNEEISESMSSKDFNKERETIIAELKQTLQKAETLSSKYDEDSRLPISELREAVSKLEDAINDTDVKQKHVDGAKKKSKSQGFRF